MEELAKQPPKLPVIVPVEETLRGGLYFPLSEDWELIPTTKRVKLAPDEEVKVIASMHETGWLLGGGLYADSRKVRMTIKLEHLGTVYEVSGTPEEVYNLGLTVPYGLGLWVSRYDTANNVYNMVASFNPWVPYKGSVEVKAKNEDTATAAVVVSYVRIKLRPRREEWTGLGGLAKLLAKLRRW